MCVCVCVCVCVCMFSTFSEQKCSDFVGKPEKNNAGADGTVRMAKTTLHLFNFLSKWPLRNSISGKIWTFCKMQQQQESVI